MAIFEPIRTTGQPEYDPTATGPRKTVVEISKAHTAFQPNWARMSHQEVLTDIYTKIASIRRLATPKTLQKVTHTLVAYDSERGFIRITFNNLLCLGVMNAHKVSPNDLHKYVYSTLVKYLAAPGKVSTSISTAGPLKVTMVNGTKL